MKININSEIGDIEGVILHTPGPEVENMTPQNAERALYSDILNLSVASREYDQFKKVLKKITKVYEVSELLRGVISDDDAKRELVQKICNNENIGNITDQLLEKSSEELSTQLIQGVPILKQSNLTNFLTDDRYLLQPLHNFFFTRDASISINDKVLIGKLANKVREREAIIMESIFNCTSLFEAETINPNKSLIIKNITIEGGDLLVAREDIILVGMGARTTTQGIDYLIEYYKQQKKNMNIIVQVLPKEPESFIHLDMVFTFVDKNKCLIYAPVILNQHAFETVNISIRNGKVKNIREEKNILSALAKLGMKLEPIYCGGNNDEWIQEREQWHSGANFFAIGPGKIIGYDRNEYTIEEINKNGFEVIRAKDIINNKVKISQYNKFVITIDGTELARGGGGCRCMTMPVKRKDIN
ncbi:MAG: arginine deiminase family protein [Melioribacteraceae bacterium]|nr:arginine deiminase family protein [Melioribacteraceae bacterium]